MKNYKHINYIHFQTIDSTNTWAKNNASILDPDQITCITAYEQTAGRGRFQRKWISPKGVNLYCSFFLCIPEKSSFIPNLGQLLCISCCKVLINLGFAPKLKWPNDVLLENKKMAGILCETVQLQDSLGVVLGIGININMDAESMAAIDQPVTSLKVASQKEWPLEKILKNLCAQFLEDFSLLEKERFQPFVSFYESHLAFKGQEITVLDGSREITGICEGISKEGNLKLSRGKEIIEVHAGSMIFP